MKRIVFVSVLCLLCLPHEVEAQLVGGSSAYSANQQLRAMFANIDPPTPQPPIFYDMAVHFIDKSWWRPIQSDTSNTTVWAIMYDEMYTSHYDTTQFLRVDTVFLRADKWGADTVVIGIVDYLYCTLKDSALYDTTYFHIDTTGPTLYDNPNATSSPYIIDTVFNVCAFQDNNTSGSLVFRVDPDFLFFSSTLQIPHSDFDDRQLQLDFDDGTGWHTFPVDSLSFQTVNYPTEGVHTISARIIQTQGSIIEAFAMSKMASPAADSTLPIQDTTWKHIEGMEVGVYGSCQYAFGSQPEKFVIVLEGFDFMEDVGVSSIYAHLIRSTGLEYLRNYGYTFLTVNWIDSKRSMIDNAMSVVKLVDYLKCTYLGQAGDDPQHQFVMMGESMGGVIARYALTYMEANPSFSQCQPNLHHNTRLYISIDAPHQGAYVPLAFQELYDDAMILAGLPANILMEQKKMADIKNTMAATQLMNLHSATNTPPSTVYSPHPNRVDFLDSLTALNPTTGGYPEHIKMMAISNGLLTGEQQLGLDEECVMSAGDAYMLADLNVYQQILAIPYEGQRWHIELRGIKNGQPFYRIDYTETDWGIQLKWKTIQKCLWPFNWPCFNFAIPWGVEIGMVAQDSASKICTVNNQPSYDIMPGGKLGFDGGLGSTKFHFGTLWSLTIPWFTPPQIPTSCPFDTAHSQRVNAFLFHTGYDLTVVTQGLNFCFVPVQSALDYTGPVPQNHDIYNDNINTTLSRTPFDVIVGEVNGQPGYPQDQHIVLGMTNNRWFRFPSYNLDHVSLRNHQLSDSVLQNMTLLGIPNSQLFAYPNYVAQYLNREIGDEEMLIDNLVLDRWALFQAEYDIRAGSKVNPYYAYPSQPVQPQNVFKVYGSQYWGGSPNPYGYNLPNNGIFAKEKPFTIEQQKSVWLLAQNSINTAGTVVLGNLYINFVPQWVCDSITFNKRGEQDEQVEGRDAGSGETVLYPSPVSAGGRFFLSPLGVGKHRFELYSMDGRLMESWEVEATEGTIVEVRVSPSLASGVYFLRVLQGVSLKTHKFVVR